MVRLGQNGAAAVVLHGVGGRLAVERGGDEGVAVRDDPERAERCGDGGRIAGHEKSGEEEHRVVSSL